LAIPIHLMPHPVREAAKAALHSKGPKGNLFNIPNTTGVGIGEGHVKVTVTAKHPLHQALPTSINGVPVVVEQRPPISHHATALEGGMPVIANDTMFSVVVDNSGQRFLLGCAHSFAYLKNGAVVFNGQTVGQFTRSALACGQTANHLDASIAAVSPGVTTSFDIVGLGTPKGAAEPVAGQFANMQGAKGGKRRGKITATNYDFADTYPEFNNCKVSHVGLFETENSGVAGDSGAPVWNDAGYVMGIHFAGSSNGSIGLQCDTAFLQSDLGVHLGVGAPASSVTLHTASAPAPDMTPLLLGGAAALGLLLFMK
jgi:hypothetical protein